jgi:F-type H+-transporting ATPase subunit b
MNDTLRQLGALFAQSAPTAILVLILLVILDYLFFKPLAKVLGDREAASSGALARAKEHRETVAAKSAEYEARFQAARQEVYRRRELGRQKALAERERALRRAREQAEAWLKEALAGVAQEVEAARGALGAECRALAVEIADTVLGENLPPRPSADGAGRPGRVKP